MAMPDTLSIYNVAATVLAGSTTESSYSKWLNDFVFMTARRRFHGDRYRRLGRLSSLLHSSLNQYNVLIYPLEYHEPSNY